jgi:hypothetical protein
MAITRTAFQPSAFQFTGFQEASTVSGSGWGWWEYFRARAAAIARRKRTEEERKHEEQDEVVADAAAVIAYARLGMLRPSVIARPVVTDLSALAARLSPPIDTELLEFRAFMEMLAELEEA